MLLTPPSAAAHFSDRGLGHAGSTAHEAASALTWALGVPTPWVPGLFCLLPLGLALLCQRAKLPPVFFFRRTTQEMES